MHYIEQIDFIGRMFRWVTCNKENQGLYSGKFWQNFVRNLSSTFYLSKSYGGKRQKFMRLWFDVDLLIPKQQQNDFSLSLSMYIYALFTNKFTLLLSFQTSYTDLKMIHVAHLPIRPICFFSCLLARSKEANLICTVQPAWYYARRLYFWHRQTWQDMLKHHVLPLWWWQPHKFISFSVKMER